MISLKEDEETGIIYRQWKFPSPKAILLLVHGLGAHTGRWEFLADFFLRNDISSYAIELKGFGQTKDLKGHVDSFKVYLDDIRRLYEIITIENQNRKIFILGESMGALLSFLTAVSLPNLFEGLICLSPAFTSRLRFTFLDYIKIFSSILYNPKKQFTMPFDSGMCTRDVDYRQAMDSDPLEHHLATSKLLVETAFAQLRCRILKSRLGTPVLFLVPGNDEIVDSKAAKIVFKDLKIEDKELIEYPEMYHSISIDLGREAVFQDILRWLQKKI